MTSRQSRETMRTEPGQIAVPMPVEAWRRTTFESYFVSSYGRVCSVDRIVNGKLCRGRVLKPGTYPSGHKYVLLGRGNHQQVHVLVLTAFVGPCPEGHEGLHRDDNPANNWLLNLRWGTRSENLYDAIGNGKKPIGEQVYNSKLNEDAVRYIRANPQFSLNSLGVRFGVSAQAIKQVREFTTWKYVA